MLLWRHVFRFFASNKLLPGKQISIVSQEPVLFNCSIEENIAYGLDVKASSVDVENAAVSLKNQDLLFTK